MDLQPDEQAYLSSNDDRCTACGHLALLHNDHCCEFCLIPDCMCEWGEWPKCKHDGCDEKVAIVRYIVNPPYQDKTSVYEDRYHCSFEHMQAEETGGPRNSQKPGYHGRPPDE